MDFYKKAGVDIKAGENAVSGIKKMVRSTFSENVITDIGGFGGCFTFPVGKYKNPVLVSSTDGVGTKLMIANMMNKHNTVGQCLVNHCVNDILAIGAEPLYFLDYIGTGKLDPQVFNEVISGFTKACKENNCSLIGGETAEMPGIYQEKDYDLAGAITGVVEKENMLSGRVKKGDVLIGLPSNGLHTNGYSLARNVLLKKYSVNDKIEALDGILGDELLKVHRSYLDVVRPFLKSHSLHGISHITGGGICGNTKRILTEDLKLSIDWDSWEWLPIFKLIMDSGEIPIEEMRKVFNLGIGLILVVEKNNSSEFLNTLQQNGEKPVIVGSIV